MLKTTYILLVKTAHFCFLEILYYFFGISSVSPPFPMMPVVSVFEQCSPRGSNPKMESCFQSETNNDNFVLSMSLSLGSVVPKQPVLQSDMVLLPGLHRTL